MKNFVCLLLLTITCRVHAQEWVGLASDDVCSCMKREGLNKESFQYVFAFCTGATLPSYYKDMRKSIDYNGAESAETQKKIIKKRVVNDICQNVTNNCGEYFEAIENWKSEALYEYAYMSDIYNLDSLNQKIDEDENADRLAQRGEVLFGFKKYKEAKVDFQKALAMDSIHEKSLYFQAWMLEMDKDYQAALQNYARLYELHENNLFYLSMKSVAGRKAAAYEKF